MLFRLLLLLLLFLFNYRDWEEGEVYRDRMGVTKGREAKEKRGIFIDEIGSSFVSVS